MVITDKEIWSIRAPLDYEGPNYTAGELKSDLGSFFASIEQPEYRAYDDWEFQYFNCSMPKEQALMFLLKHPKYERSFTRGTP